MNLSQFIHGKTLGGRNYDLVALTPDLAGREAELEAVAQKYRFWGSQPPVDNPIAVGIFHYGNGLLLAQAMLATLSTGRLAADVQGRPYTQHRYVFISPEALDGLSGRLWLLLNWIMEETRGIPVFEAPARDLAPLSAPQFDRRWYNPAEELDKLKQSLTLKDRAGRPVLLSVLAALSNRKRVVFDAAAIDNVFSEDLLEGTFLLLPAACRNLVSVAAGALDERVCTHANLMLKTNGTPGGPLADDLVWAKRANNQFFGAVENGALDSGYSRLLQPILVQPDSLTILLRILDGLTVTETDPWQFLNSGRLAPHLIPAMPDPERRAKYWRSALKDLSPAEWEAILPSVVDDTGLEIAWAELKKLAARQPAPFAPLVFRLWRNFSGAYIRYVLREELPADTKLAEGLLRHGLPEQVGAEHQADFLGLCRHLIAAKADHNRLQAAELANLLLKTGKFNTLAEKFSLQEAVLPDKIGRADLVTAFNDLLAPVLPDLSPDALTESRIYRAMLQLAPELAALVERVVSGKARALPVLPELANGLKMLPGQRADLYAACLSAWQPAWPPAQPLLTDLVTQWIAAWPPENRPHLTTLFTGMIGWINRFAPEPIRPLLTVSGADFAFEDWDALAGALFADPLGQASFMDHVTEGDPLERMVSRWLRVTAENPAAAGHFEASYTRHALQTIGPAWLAEGVGQLLGWEKTSFSALLPLFDRLQAALNLPQPVLFKFIERLPGGGDDDLGFLLAAYLPQLAAGKNGEVESLPMWQMLNAQAPKVAQVYKILAEGQKNPALDKFNQLKLNAALTEAPEYATALAHWLQMCGKGSWLKGGLLETVMEQWQANPSAIDPLLLARLLQPELAEKYAFSDWLALAKICWRPEYQSLWPADNSQPAPDARRRTQVLAVAADVSRQYTSPEQARKLVQACRDWNLPVASLAELVSNFPAKLCNFKLLHPYLYADGSVINPQDHTSQNLLAMAMQLAPTDVIEQAQFKLFLTRLLTQQLRREDGVAFLTTWNQVVTQRRLYEQALTAAVLKLAPNHFSVLVRRAHQLAEQGVKDLSKTIVLALDAYWTGQKQTLGK